MKPVRSANPFELLLHPEEVLKAVESSERLGGLRSTVFRPLDRPSAVTEPPGEASGDEEVGPGDAPA